MIIVQEQIPFPAWLAELREKLWSLIAQKCAHSGDAQRYEESLVARVGFIAESRGLRDRHVVDEQLKEVATKWPNGIIVILRGNAHHRMLDGVDTRRYRCLIAHTFSLDPEWHEPISWVGNWSADHPDFILSPAVRTYMSWQQTHFQAMDRILKDPSVQNLRSDKERVLSGMSKVLESDVLSQLRRDASPIPAGCRVLEVAT